MNTFVSIGGEQPKLNHKELLFANYYLGEARFNATEAAKLAGYSERSARQQGSRLMTNAAIKQYIHEQAAPVLKALGVTKDQILAELVELAFTRPGQAITKESPIPIGYQESKNFKTLKTEGVDVVQEEKTVSFNYSPKMKALTMLSEYLGLMDRNSKPIEVSPQQVSVYNQVNNYLKEI